MAYQVVLKLSISPYIITGQSNPVRGIGSQESTEVLGTALLSLLGVTQKTKLHNCQIYLEGQVQHADPPGCWLGLCKFLEPD